MRTRRHRPPTKCTSRRCCQKSCTISWAAHRRLESGRASSYQLMIWMTFRDLVLANHWERWMLFTVWVGCIPVFILKSACEIRQPMAAQYLGWSPTSRTCINVDIRMDINAHVKMSSNWRQICRRIHTWAKYVGNEPSTAMLAVPTQKGDSF